MKKVQAFFALTILALLVSACSSLGLAKPETFDQKLVVAYSTVTAVSDSTTQLLLAGKISKAEATNLHDRLSQAITLLDGAKAVYATNPKQATDKVSAALGIITALQTFLTSRGGA